MLVKEAKAIAHTLSTPAKMPGKSYGLSANFCKTGGKLTKVKGSICSDCYAFKGAYAWESVTNAHKKRLNSLRNPRWVEAMSKLIAKQTYFRWHDSGDLQGVWHLENIAQVANLCPNTNFWLPTKEYKMVRTWLKDNPQGFPANLNVKLSIFMTDVFVVREGSLLDKHCSWAAAHSSEDLVPAAFNACPSSNPSAVGASCDTFSCRKCWSDENVSYHLH